MDEVVIAFKKYWKKGKDWLRSLNPQVFDDVTEAIAEIGTSTGFFKPANASDVLAVIICLVAIPIVMLLWKVIGAYIFIMVVFGILIFANIHLSKR